MKGSKSQTFPVILLAGTDQKQLTMAFVGELTDPGGPSDGVTQLDEPTTSNQTLGARMKLVKSPPARLLKLRDSHFLFMENSCPDDFLEEEVEMSRNEVF